MIHVEKEAELCGYSGDGTEATMIRGDCENGRPTINLDTRTLMMGSWIGVEASLLLRERGR